MAGAPGSRHTALTWPQRRFLLLLALPAFGIAFAYTVVTTYGPVLLGRFAGPSTIGILIGSEGVLALVIPLLVGGWSDRLRTRVGGRLPFVLAAAVVAAVALVLLPLAGGSPYLVVPALLLFFAAYFTYYAPYYALYPDLVPEGMEGRSQGFQGGLRAAGLLLALAGGGVLLALWRPLPFVLAAAVLLLLPASLVAAVRGRSTDVADGERGNGAAAALAILRADRRIRNWAVANACWEAALGALRTFVVLYFTAGLGFSLSGTSGALALVGVAAVVAAPLAGKLGDRYGVRRVMIAAALLFAVGVTPAVVTTDTTFVAAILPVAFAAVVLLTLPYSQLMSLLPERTRHGVGAGLFGFSRGVGLLAGPLLAGQAIDALRGVPVLSFAATEGYSAIFAVAAVFLLAGVWFQGRTATRTGTGPPRRAG
ncbi:Na+/melibiose symporter-like transporter [Prauserella shujinwangii]|uniref:Na+/melibiose symporter-like transporter n=2 Tax=Prauserella shujinwangii TaxID=1453103 RepID=A0A2T0LL09_9PSEU|nr:Na+/melibiose symporter-like transporter [Prauserella shujinwangii]